MEGGLIMTIEEKESRLEEIVNCLKKRNILRVREILISNLLDYPNDKDFLTQCYHLVLGDPIVFQKHNQEMLDYKLQHWDEEQYPTLLKDLKKNYSRRRYHLAMELAIYFAELKQPKDLEENEEELEIEIKPVKKKKPKKPKRIMPPEEKYTLTGIGTTTALLLIMIVQLLIKD